MYWLPPSRVKQSGKATTGGMRAHRSILLVANSLDWVKDGDAWNGVPDNKIYVIDLTATRQRVDPDKISRWR
jgi:hypothetical protein